MASFYNDIYEIIDAIDVSDKWKSTFKKIYTVYYQNFSEGNTKNVHFWSPSPIVSVLGIIDKWKFHCLFNFAALFLGPIYYFIKGMVPKGLLLGIIWLVLFNLNDLTRYAIPFLHIYCAVYANSDYFLMKVAKHEAVKKDPRFLGDYVNESYFYMIADNQRPSFIEPLMATIVTMAIMAFSGLAMYNNVVALLAVNHIPEVCKDDAECTMLIEEQKAKLQARTGNLSNINYKIGCAYASKGDYKNAILAANQALKINPKNTLVYILRANIYFETKENKNAILNYQKALELNPGLKAINYNIGRCYYRAKQYATALNYFKKATKAYPFIASYVEMQGYAKIATKDKSGAKKDLEKAMSLYSRSNDPESQQKINKIQSYLGKLK